LGYSGPQELKEIKGEQLASFINGNKNGNKNENKNKNKNKNENENKNENKNENVKELIKECIPSYREKRRISQALLIDYLKLTFLILKGEIHYGIVIGLYKNYKTRKLNCNLASWLKRLFQKLKKFLRENMKNIERIQQIDENIQVFSLNNDLKLIIIHINPLPPPQP